MIYLLFLSALCITSATSCAEGVRTCIGYIYVTNGARVALYNDDQLTEQNLAKLTRDALRLTQKTPVTVTYLRLNRSVAKDNGNESLFKELVHNGSYMLIARIPYCTATPTLHIPSLQKHT